MLGESFERVVGLIRLDLFWEIKHVAVDGLSEVMTPFSAVDCVRVDDIDKVTNPGPF